MKLKPYQLCRWCDAALHGRHKWLTLAADLLLLVLAAALDLLRLFLPPLLLVNTAAGLYLLHRHHAFGAAYQRKPRPGDALCETILIDASLIGQGTRLRAAAQPIDVADGLSMRLGSGALLLGAAMTLTADTLFRADRAAILSAVQALNIKPGRLRSHNPVLRKEEDGSVAIITVRDGMSDRRYFSGEPEEVAKRCASIWEGHTRPMKEQDHERIADTARYITQGNCRVTAWATALENEEPIFLGMAGVGESVDLHALQEAAALRAMGLTLMLDPGDQADTDLESLRALMELPDHHARADIHLAPRDVGATSALGITCQPGDSLLEPISLLRQRFRTIEDTLRRYALLLAIPMLLALLLGSWPAALVSALLLGYTAIALGVDLQQPAPRWQTLLSLGAAALVAKAFLLTQPGPLALMGGGILTVLTGAGCALRLCGPAFRLKGPEMKASLPLPIFAGGYAVAAVLCALSAGAALLLPLGFALLMAAVILLLLLFERVIFK